MIHDRKKENTNRMKITHGGEFLGDGEGREGGGGTGLKRLPFSFFDKMFKITVKKWGDFFVVFV